MPASGVVRGRGISDIRGEKVLEEQQIIIQKAQPILNVSTLLQARTLLLLKAV